MTDLPAVVQNDRSDIVAMNPLARALDIELSNQPRSLLLGPVHRGLTLPAMG
ncbi:hypothetical protein AB0F81_06720 [Actinoplanes sp. NPDC024001]|uniref:MmyB family transcriptional regulator n=1 Tax=Actinoplanes sp. NPDC024001 TaxID=3154598 RepID=UPI0033F941BD